MRKEENIDIIQLQMDIRKKYGYDSKVYEDFYRMSQKSYNSGLAYQYHRSLMK